MSIDTHVSVTPAKPKAKVSISAASSLKERLEDAFSTTCARTLVLRGVLAIFHKCHATAEHRTLRNK